MQKTNTLWIILRLIFPVVFNAAFFVLGGVDHKASVWISYGFIHFAYLMLLLMPKLIRKGKSVAVFGASLYLVSAVYFFVAFATGIAFILNSPDSYKTAFSVQLCLAGLYSIVLISNTIANVYTADSEEMRQYQVEYVKAASAKLKSLLEVVSDKEAKKKIEKIYDALYASPVKSHLDLAQVESQILMSINKLDNAVSIKNKDDIISLSDSLLIAVNERNRQLKMLNL